jgi:uncharacterized protein YjbI with pentapeptide repeats
MESKPIGKRPRSPHDSDSGYSTDPSSKKQTKKASTKPSPKGQTRRSTPKPRIKKPKKMSKEESEEKIREIKRGTVNKASLAGIILHHVDFKNIDIHALSKANMKHASMIDVGFHKLNLNSADFTGSEMDDVEFTDTSLFGTKFNHSKIHNSSFTNVQTLDTDFSDAHISDTFISTNRWRDAIFQRTTFKNVTFGGKITKATYQLLSRRLSLEQRNEITIYTLEGERVAFHEFAPDSPPPPPPKRPRPEPMRAPSIKTDATWVPGAKSDITGCPSDGLKPSNNCTKKKQQSLVFHPDKNPACADEATAKMKVLNALCP